MTQLDLFAARKARDKSVTQVEKNADEGWNDRAYLVARQVAESKGEFTTDDLWAAGLDRPHESRALGPVLLRLQREGIIEPAGFKQTSQVSRHAAPVRVWRSVR